MARRQWQELPPTVRRAIVVAAATDAGLRVAALADLAKRPPRQVRGTKRRWALALAVVNSAGVLPLAYFRWGRSA